MNTQNKSVPKAPPPTALDQICLQRLLSPNFARPLKINQLILKYLRSFKRSSGHGQ